MKKKIMAIVLSLILMSALLPSLHVLATDKSLEKIKSKNSLVVGTSADFPPYEFHANLDGKDEIVGMDISIAKKIAKDLGVELKVRDIGFESLLPALEVGKVDIIISGMSASNERKESVDFSEVYYIGGQSLVVRPSDNKIYASKEDLYEKKIGVQTGSIQESLAKEQMAESSIMSLSKMTDLILALKTNKIEAIIMEKPSAMAYVANDDGLATFDGGFELEEDEQGAAVAVKKGSENLVASINQSIAIIKENNLTKDYLKEAGELLKESRGQQSQEGSKSKTMVNYWSYFAKGTGYTILISVLSVFFGTILGVILSLMRMSDNKFISIPATAYVEFVRGTPLLIQVMFIYFAVGYLINIPALASGIIAVSLNSGAYICEIIRSGLNSVSKGQTEAARSLGMSKKTAMRYIIFPQGLKNIWPALGNEFITVIKESSIVSIIGVGDLIFQTKIVTSLSYRGIAPLAVTMVIYFILTFSLTKCLNHYERKMDYD
ncbi:ABC transporter substrate-binding protein/permease [Carnobacterium funditum]|uniref:ABC transporter substrate-binding protein/permease n=1 Tax=Carnobacterium funditum TaxID=2752 RepID=UPI000554A231|nr:ABC transporter substrate-binding protein/permease [Carnobacterium funditum]